MSHQITPEIAAQAALLDPDDFLIEEEHYCGTCGEPFEPGQEVLSVHAPYADIGTHRAIEDIHLRCYQGEGVHGGER